ncbi:MAG: molecular chaperone TorD family protein [Candidatus Riflebacteria bacterium]|nr:molecular chaperone TorD family protein [Candidatus Riflebacteria bacterium]
MSDSDPSWESRPENGVRALLARAARYRAVSLLLAPPDRSVLADLAALVDALPPAVEEPITRLIETDLADAQGDYHRLLGSSGTLSACATGQAACGPGQKAAVMADAAGFYRAFGYDPAGHLAECPDHASVLFGFAGYLALKEALACHRGDVEAAEVCRDAAVKFHGTHVAPWFDAFLDRLGACAGEGHVGRAVRIVSELTGPGRGGARDSTTLA